jgi:hypothetical protein
MSDQTPRVNDPVNEELIDAVKEGNLPKVRTLLNDGADPHQGDQYGTSAAQHAKGYQHLDGPGGPRAEIHDALARVYVCGACGACGHAYE